MARCGRSTSTWGGRSTGRRTLIPRATRAASGSRRRWLMLLICRRARWFVRGLRIWSRSWAAQPASGCESPPSRRVLFRWSCVDGGYSPLSSAANAASRIGGGVPLLWARVARSALLMFLGWARWQGWSHVCASGARGDPWAVIAGGRRVGRRRWCGPRRRPSVAGRRRRVVPTAARIRRLGRSRRGIRRFV